MFSTTRTRAMTTSRLAPLLAMLAVVSSSATAHGASFGLDDLLRDISGAVRLPSLPASRSSFIASDWDVPKLTSRRPVPFPVAGERRVPLGVPRGQVPRPHGESRLRHRVQRLRPQGHADRGALRPVPMLQSARRVFRHLRHRRAVLRAHLQAVHVQGVRRGPRRPNPRGLRAPGHVHEHHDGRLRRRIPSHVAARRSLLGPTRRVRLSRRRRRRRAKMAGRLRPILPRARPPAHERRGGERKGA